MVININIIQFDVKVDLPQVCYPAGTTFAQCCPLLVEAEL